MTSSRSQGVGGRITKEAVPNTRGMLAAFPGLLVSFEELAEQVGDWTDRP
jgi:hypothetical protein